MMIIRVWADRGSLGEQIDQQTRLIDMRSKKMTQKLVIHALCGYAPFCLKYLQCRTCPCECNGDAMLASLQKRLISVKLSGGNIYVFFVLTQRAAIKGSNFLET